MANLKQKPAKYIKTQQYPKYKLWVGVDITGQQFL
jgi:hypothetical protein